MADDMKTTRRTFIGGAAAAAGWAAIAAPLPTAEVIRPEDFGAKGDGVANDSQAFAAMSAHVNRRGGGTIVLRKTTYLVGRQVAGEPDWAFTPGRVIELRGLRLPLVIRGNGARLKCAPGLRYGSFDRRSGAVANIPMPHSRQDVRASPYWAMIIVMDSTAPVEITDLELDGSINELRIGGGFGDSGIQISASGIFLRDNHDTETVRNVHSHHHGQDGVMVDGDDKRRARSRFEDVVCEYNGRQGMSLIGGRGYDFLRCKFNHTGRSKVASAPVAGFDIEAEGGKVNRDMTFTDCEFSNNVGCGLVADSNDSEGATFTRCRFIGTTNWSAWPRKPRFVFRGCTFVGTLVHAHVDADPNRATQFHDCRFSDDPRLSPTGEVYLAGKKHNAIVDLAESDNVQFNRCSFLLVRDGLLPWSWRALYTDCTMQQAAPIEAYPKGKYFGRSTIKGKVDMYGTIVVGTLNVNGQILTGIQLGGEPW
jgi:hypothetical protein